MAEIDLTQLEGHTPGPWWCHGQVWIEGGCATLADLVEASKADAALMTAAPMLLAEVKRQAEEIERLQGALAQIHGEFVNGSRQLYTTTDSTLDRIRTTAKTALEGTK